MRQCVPYKCTIAKVKVYRNRGPLPFLPYEGKLIKPLIQKPEEFCGNDPNLRLNAHHTLNSLRRSYLFRRYPNTVPQDSLDFILSSVYDHAKESFESKQCVVLQHETIGTYTWRRLQNVKEVKVPVISEKKEESLEGSQKLKKRVPREGKEFYKCDPENSIVIGGVKERKHPCNVKLMNIGNHLPQTNPGYSRQNMDGLIFYY